MITTMYQIIKLTLLSFLSLIFLVDLQGQQDNSASEKKGYQLMKTYCYICHNPNVTSHNQMVAPPMMMVKQHYQPNYPKKEDFINAIISWVHHPSSAKVLMPGAVRKFKIMPPLAYSKNDVIVIATYIFDHEIDKPAIMKQMKGDNMTMGTSSLSLNEGNKWKVDAASIKTMHNISKLLENFTGEEVSDYHKLGKDVFNKSKQIILDEKNKGEVFEQLQIFFHESENNMHRMMEVKNCEEGEKYKGLLEIDTRKFNNYFKEK